MTERETFIEPTPPSSKKQKLNDGKALTKSHKTHLDPKPLSYRSFLASAYSFYEEEKLFDSICDGKSMGTNNVDPNFYASSIVAGIIPLALGAATGLHRLGSESRVWCFIGDMTAETGVFHEAYKYAKNFELPLQWVIEDNNMSVHTPTDMAWGSKQGIPDDIIYYQYEMEYPHHGTGKWVNF